VVLDKWDLKEGQDKHKFMERAVTDSEIKKVLIICDKTYQDKADQRKGGVGTETQLISQEIYENVGQKKFIPIIREKNTNGKPHVPVFIKNRIFIDLANNEIYEVEYEKLLRNLYDKPLYKKPSLGEAPSYVLDEEAVVLATTSKINSIKNAISRDSKNINGLISDYCDSFLKQLEDFRITENQPEEDEIVYQNISKMLPFRDDFIKFIETIFRYQEKVDLENLYDLFEKLISFRNPPPDAQYYNADNFKFFNYELFLYLIALLLKIRKYKEAAGFIHHTYFCKDDRSRNIYPREVSAFNDYIKSLDEDRNKRLNQNRVSITADTIKHRANNKLIGFSDLIQVDMLLYYIGSFCMDDYPWFPRCSVYSSYYAGIDIFQKMISKEYFEKVKCLFRIATIEEFKETIDAFIADRNSRLVNVGHGYHHLYRDRELKEMLDIERIGTID